MFQQDSVPSDQAYRNFSLPKRSFRQTYGSVVYSDKIWEKCNSESTGKLRDVDELKQ